jgi:hypothetical protein
MIGQDEDWVAYRKLVIAMLERNENTIKELADKLAKTETDLATLKATVLAWGTVAGIISAGIVSVVVAVVTKALGG